MSPSDFDPDVMTWARERSFLLGPDYASWYQKLARLWSQGSPAACLGHMRRMIFPSPDAVARDYGLPVGSPRVYLMYPRRWVDLVMRSGRVMWRRWRGDGRGLAAMAAHKADLEKWLSR